ncbi:MAG: hypothetical protein RLZZ200_2015 [Pseudomonadota bacterium]|jgi:colicin import membrane protein
MTENRSDRWQPIGLAVAFHASLAAALLWGYWQFHKPVTPAPQVLAIEATVVDANRLVPSPVIAPAPAAETPPPAEATPEPVVVEPKPDRKAAARAKKAEERARKEVAKMAAAEKARLEKAERAERDKAERAEKEKAEKAEKAREAVERKAREDAERKAREEVERVAREKAVSDRQTAQRESELRARMAAEERFAYAKASGLLAQYQAQIQARIERAWIRPASARTGLSCEVRITQIPGGEVTGVQVGRCNGDESVRQSIEAAAYRASPLPQPPDAALFDRNLVVTFRPQD